MGSNPYATRPIQERHTIQLEPTRFSLEDKKRIEEAAAQGLSEIDLMDLVLFLSIESIIELFLTYLLIYKRILTLSMMNI